MINNRQNGRRRGRGGQQVRGGQPGTPDRGNRLDSRARGNAAQLLEKYKSLARDAQMSGDRVTTEYYLQFADHYFRVLAETRSRFEEARPARRDEYRDDMGQDDEGDGPRQDHQRGYDQQGNGQADGGWNADDEDRGDVGDDFVDRQPQRRYEQPRREEQPRRDRAPRFEGGQGGDARQGGHSGDTRQGGDPAGSPPRPVMQDEGERYQERRPRQPRAPREGNRALPRDEQPAGQPAASDDVAERIEIDRLPQGFGTGVAATEGEEAPAERPRRRAPRRPRPELGTADA